MSIFFWIIDLLIPFTMIIIGIIYKRFTPKKINKISGYRTRRSMLSIYTWQYSNGRMAELWLKWGALLFFIIIISKLIVPIDEESLSMIHTFLGMGVLIIAIPIIEKELKEKFDEKGKPKKKRS